jgi:hypothetical protein
LARIDKPAVFHTEAEPVPGREAAEPWRVLKSSLAVRFNSRRHTTWGPETVSAHDLSLIIRAIEARDKLAAEEMALRTAMRDLLRAATQRQIVRLESPVWMLSDCDLRKSTVHVVSIANALLPHRNELLELLVQINKLAARLDQIAKGFVQVLEEQSGEIRMIFSLGSHIALTPSDAEREARRLRKFLQNATAGLDEATHVLKGVEPK